MSATNSTPNYELPIFQATDKPAWLTDWNGAMTDIDTAIKEAKTAGDNAQQTANGAVTDIATINSSLTTINTTLTTLTTNVNSNTGAINTINSLIGNGEPTTSDKTLIGAINELYNDIHGGGDPIVASNVGYNNATSGLSATDVQSAIDELAQVSPSTGLAKPVLVSGTLQAGQTSITLTDASITASKYLDVYTADGTPYTSISQAVGSVTIGFDAQQANLAVTVAVFDFA